MLICCWCFCMQFPPVYSFQPVTRPSECAFVLLKERQIQPIHHFHAYNLSKLIGLCSYKNDCVKEKIIHIYVF